MGCKKYLMVNLVKQKIYLEEYLDGEEMSFFIISDGKNYKMFGTAQDHKELLREIRKKYRWNGIFTFKIRNR